ncbi:MAG: LysM peptidoglycan-binding domain-containing protein, partial [Anaerolineales bacterium]|nr:LysM peptidoglycan-binding domain-containing protein [Anaerolineales bacterium]
TLVVYVNRYGVTARAIIDANPSLRVNPALLVPGQKLLIPATGTVTATATAAPTQAAAASATPAPTSMPGPTAAPNLTPIPSEFIRVVVQRGESLVTYVTRFAVSASSLLAANPTLRDNPSLIYPGQTLVIPVVTSFTPSRTTPFYYVVQAADTAALIARRFELTADTLLRANPGVSFQPGVTVLVPAGPHVYVVQKGDELRDIAKLYGTTVEFILRGNNLPNPDLIYIGQEIFIPTQYNALPVPFGP